MHQAPSTNPKTNSTCLLKYLAVFKASLIRRFNGKDLLHTPKKMPIFTPIDQLLKRKEKKSI